MLLYVTAPGLDGTYAAAGLTRRGIDSGRVRSATAEGDHWVRALAFGRGISPLPHVRLA